MTISVVTTFHAKGLQQYGQRMIDSFIDNWPEEVKLHVYAEDCNPQIKDHNRVVLYDLHSSVPDLVAFKNTWKDVPKANGDVSGDPIRSRRRDSGKGFKWDAIRFAHKVYSIFHCARVCDTQRLMWMDADTFCHSPITYQRLNELTPPNFDVCFLGRKGKFSECGLYSLTLGNKQTKRFMREFQRVYDEAENEGIFQMAEWHDSFVFDVVRQRVKMHEWDWAAGLVTGEGHPLINSMWGAYLDHLKGGRKALGKSKRTDLLVPRTEPYWNQ